MSFNLIDLLKGEVGSQLTSAASSFLGESESSTSSAISAILPTLVGGLINKGTTESGANNIMNLLNNNANNNSNLLSNISGVLSGNGISSLIGGGSSIVSSLFGDKVGGIVDLISGFSGIKKSSTTSLLGLAAPFVMSMLGKKVKSDGLGISGLMSLLSSQKGAVAAAMPAGLSGLTNLIGFNASSSASTTTASATSTRSTTSSSTESNNDGGGSMFGKLWPWLLLLLLGAGLFYFFKGCGNKAAESVENAVDATTTAIDSAAIKATDAVESAGETVTNLAGKVVKAFKMTLPGGYELKNASDGGIESQLITFLQDSTKVADKTVWFNFDNLLFETGKSTLTPESQVQLENVSEILKAFPKVEVKIGGYTDNVGDAKKNMALSADRAKSVMSELVKKGINASRMKSEGYGDQHPVASNDTEEGRAQNRRISINVTKK
ncbi:MAG: OmpA family protein [Saprospiraceae bacterium]|nr:OmpA family protein [Saprospiraceae bacterium]